MRLKIISFLLIFSVVVFPSIIFKGMTPFVENESFVLSNENVVASIGNDGLLENLALKDTMFDAVYNMYFTLDKSKVSFEEIKVSDNKKILAYGTNGVKDVIVEYSLIKDGLHVSVLSKEPKELRVFFKESDLDPIFLKEKNYTFIQCRHVAYGIFFPNALSMYRIGALMFLSIKSVPVNDYSKFDFDIILDKDIHHLKEKLGLIDYQNKYIVLDTQNKPVDNIKVVMLNGDTPVDVSTSKLNGEIYFSGNGDNFKLLNEDLKIRNFTKDRIFLDSPKETKFLWKPYLTGLSTDSVYVVFKVNKPSTAVLFINGKMIEDNLYDTFHMIKVDNLTPATVYDVEVVAAQLKEKISFKTAGDKKYKFLVYGDTRTNTDWHKIICDEMSKEKALFVLHTGDLVESGPQLFEWDFFFNTGHTLFSRTPIMPVIGNHEHNAVYYYQAFMPPRKGGGDFLKQWYSFDIGPVHYIVLDSNVQENTNLDFYQTQWLENDLKKTTKPYIIVLFHHPFFSNVKGRGQEFREKWHNLFVKYKVSAVFNGHIHHYERFFKDGVMYVTTGGGGAPFGYGLYSSDVSYLPFSKASAAGYLHYIVGNVEDGSIHFVVKAVAKEENRKLSKVYKILDEFDIYARNTRN
ncbi:metallophosphoesterase family protein [Thermosipho atlanticus]|uniref:Calcineurin-like phosphoesterase n=1 Tax=Thermosipho atlanticus DSM 15807 TaxID=1123380 RepID=A0A1M5RRM9_9BACT|nr:metallophosphoesterase [Thermosipho atlanticus]SHH28829.1 Calcineurin-like phosphoesterase [Thermosipho atlanticus DSM 15807]